LARKIFLGTKIYSERLIIVRLVTWCFVYNHHLWKKAARTYMSLYDVVCESNCDCVGDSNRVFTRRRIRPATSTFFEPTPICASGTAFGCRKTTGMPPGAPHHSFLLPYRIRVDDFTSPRDQRLDPPALYLLSHTHSDHITGLSARSFGARVVCSVDAKHMLLNYEPAGDRIAFDNGETTEKRNPYSHLKVDHKPPASSRQKTFSRDLLVNTCLFSLMGAVGD
jgi:hypothetical protein